MPGEGAPAGLAVHATAIAIEGRALLIFGPSRSGKSRLAATLVAASLPYRRITLVADDCVLLRRTCRGLEARPHPRIAGFIERRGFGLVAMPWCEQAIVAGTAILGDDAAPCVFAHENLPSFRLAGVETNAACAETLLDWWSRQEHGF